MRGARDYVALVEATYAPAATDVEWVEGIAQAARPIVSHDEGQLIVYIYDASNLSRVRVGAVSVIGDYVTSDAIRQMIGSTSVSMSKYLFAMNPPSGFIRNAPEDDVVLPALRATRFSDMLGIRGHNPSGRGCVISAPSRGKYRVGPRARASLNRVAVHMAAGYRLRELGRSHPDAAELVLSERGAVLHATKPADPLLASVELAFQRRNFGKRLRKAEPEQALGHWKALVEGKLSLVDFTDTDGKRFVLARRNSPGVADPRALTGAERDVAWYVAQGHSQKLVAYELGHATSTVCELLRSSLGKLGLRSKAELMAVLGTNEQDPDCVEA